MALTRKFQFDVFTDEPSVLTKIPSPPPPEPLFTEQEKERAYRQGYEDGYERGEKESLEKENASREAATEKLLIQISTQIQDFFKEIEARKEKIIHQTVSFVVQIFEKLFPILEKHFAIDQVKKLIQEVMNSQSPPSLKIITHPELQESLQKHIGEMKLPCVTTFEKNENFDLSNCRVEWQDSGVERAVSQVMSEIENLLKGFENIFEESNKNKNNI